METEGNDAQEMLDFIYQAGEQEIRLNHVSAELHQDQAQRAIASMITLNDSYGGNSAEEALAALVGNQTS